MEEKEKPYFEHKKRPRLPLEHYRGAERFFLTLCTNEKKKRFTGEWNYDQMQTFLSRSAGKYRIHVCVYCFMPEHVHLLVFGEPDADIQAFIRLFKQLTSFYFKQKTGQKLWQTSFFDRKLRTDEGTIEVAQYVLSNPVRRGLTKNPLDYPYSGSFMVPVDELV